MLRPLRSLVSVGLLIAGLWVMFSVELGDRTFAEHMDTISDTPEAQELVDGARSAVNPALQELRDRMLGEYVEAPTWIPDPTPGPARSHAPAPFADQDMLTPARTLAPDILRPDAAPEPPLPGRRPATALDDDPSIQPSLPGRR